jgi:hypothetical protein
VGAIGSISVSAGVWQLKQLRSKLLVELSFHDLNLEMEHVCKEGKTAHISITFHRLWGTDN